MIYLVSEISWIEKLRDSSGIDRTNGWKSSEDEGKPQKIVLSWFAFIIHTGESHRFT